jgi:hypothetical protein
MSRRIWEALREKRIKLRWLPQSWNFMPHLYIGGPAPGYVEQTPPEPCYVYHFPCHRADAREAAMTALNRRFGL